MCTAVIAYKIHPNYPLILLSNRDEFFNRPTAPATYWSDAPSVLGGVDLEMGGTWLGIDKSGRLALLTNYRDMSKHIENPKSRGLLPKAFLTSETDSKQFGEALISSKHAYNPYNMIFGAFDNLMYYSNIGGELISLKPGIHGLSNGLLDEAWPKVATAKEALYAYVRHINPDDMLDEETLFSILSSQVTYPLSLLPQTGIPEELEIDLSSIFIELETYGTRMQTLVYVDNFGNVTFTEHSKDAYGRWHYKRFAYKIRTL